MQVLFDNIAERSKLQTSLKRFPSNLFPQARQLSLRVPLSRLHSTTYAFYPDETHHTIRRVFTPEHAPHTKRHFCGFCGTQLSHWSEESQEEAEWVCVNLNSLRSESMERLEDAGILSDFDEDDTPQVKDDTAETLQKHRPSEGREVRGRPWFEEMIEGSNMGRVKRRRGGETSSDGRSKVEWEIVEFTGSTMEDEPRGDGSKLSTAKRKIGSIGAEDDIEMKGAE